MRRRFVILGKAFTLGTAVAIVVGLVGTPSASAQQSVNLYLGGLALRSLDGRGSDDVLFVNSVDVATINKQTGDLDRGIDVGQFNNVTVGGEFLVALGNNIEAGLGVGFYRRTVPAVYIDLENQNGSDITQDLKLRIVPFTATVRWLPLGRDSAVVPYIGGGVGVLAWRYSETGQFVDSTTGSIADCGRAGVRCDIFNDNFVGSGTATGPVVLGGARVPVGGADVGFEVRYQGAKGNLSTDDFLAPKIDLGGFTYAFTLNFRF
jgi:hypothetical protein